MGKRIPPKVFISYSHDSEEHKERVLAFSDRLREDGVECEIDQYEEAPPEGWPRWMAGRLAWAESVLIVATETYAQRFEGGGERGRGKGAKWEGAIVTQALHDSEARNEKYVPVVLTGDDARFVPSLLAGATRYDLSTRGGYDALYRRLTGQPRVTRRAVGEIRRMPTVEPKAAAPWAAAEGAAETTVPVEPRKPRPSLLEKESLLALLDATSALNEKDALEDVLVELLDIAGKLIEASAGSVILHDAERGDLYFAAATGPKKSELAHLRVPVEGSKAGDVFRSGRTLVERTVVGHYGEIDRETEFTTKSMICIPLAHRQERYGVIQMLNKKGGKEAFTERDVELLIRFGVHASIALQRAHLLEQMIGSSGMYASSDVRKDLVSLLTGRRGDAVRERLSVLSVDMRHFTKLCTDIADPKKIQLLLCDYIAMLARIAVEHRGIVHKVAGDGLYALFRGKKGATNAVHAAIAMTAGFDELVVHWRKSLRRALAYLDIGVGIATSDDMILGTVGNDRFRDFTIIGGAVNLAAPLVKAARGGKRILCDAETWASAKKDAHLSADGPTPFRPKGDVERDAPSYDIYSVRARTASAQDSPRPGKRVRRH